MDTISPNPGCGIYDSHYLTACLHQLITYYQSYIS